MNSSTAFFLFALLGAIVVVQSFTILALGPVIGELLSILFVVAMVIAAIVARRNGD